MGTVRSMMLLLSIVPGLLLGGCQKVTSSDLVGRWTNPDGANLILKADGTFSAQALPAQVFLMHDSIDAPITGTGQWQFEEHNLLWYGNAGKLQLHFDEISGRPVPRTGMSVIVSGDGSLYQWKGEEGGERYELVKRK